MIFFPIEFVLLRLELGRFREVPLDEWDSLEPLWHDLAERDTVVVDLAVFTSQLESVHGVVGLQ